MPKKALSLLILSLISGLGFAQPGYFSPIPRPPDAAGTWITDIKQDHLGYVWVANPGLARYDGSTWKTYRHDPQNPNSLASDAIESLCPGADGHIWIGTKGAGLTCLDPATGNMTHYLLKGRHTLNLEENFITVLLESRDGTLWIGTHDGLYSRDPASGRFTHYPANPADPHSLSHHQVRAIFEDRQGAIWVGTGEPTLTLPQDGGLNCLDRRTGRFTRYKANPVDAHSLIDNRVRAIFEDSRGTLWIGSYGDGLHTLDRNHGQFTRYPYDPARPGRLSRPYPEGEKVDATYGISFIQEDRAGNIWIGAYGGGLVCYNPLTNQTTRFHKGRHEGLESDFLWSACTTDDGVLCFGSIDGALMKFVDKPPQISLLKSSSYVQALYEDKSGNIWTGTGTGISIHDRDTQAEKSNPNPLQIATQNIQLTSFFEDNQHQLWCGTRGNGLFCYNLNTRTVRHFQYDPSTPKGLSHNVIGWVYQDRSGTIWVPTNGGLDVYNPDDQSFTPYLSPSADTILHNLPCLNVLEDYSGLLWIGTGGNGLIQLNRTTGALRRYLNKNAIFQTFEDADQTLWVITANETLHRYDRAHDRFVPVEIAQGTQSVDRVKSITEDNQHNLWLGTRIGIVRINRERTAAAFFDKAYGFPGGEAVYYASCLKGRDGKLYFGGNEGVYYVDPEQLQVNVASKPRLILTDLILANQSVPVNAKGPLPKPLYQLQTLYLTHRQSVFSLSFAAPEVAYPDQIHYQYKLDNYDTGWKPAPDQIASYFKVPPGKYVFRVRAAKQGGEWVERSLQIVITPPWWQRWWAYALWLGILTGAVWGIIAFRSAALQRKNQVLEEKVALRTHQLQKSIEALQATQAQLIQSEKLASLGELTAGIAHEIQNPLNFVNNFAEVSAEMLGEMEEELDKGDTSEAKAIAEDLKTNLEKIAYHGKRASSIVRSMLEHSRTMADGRDAMHRIAVDLNALADEYLRLAYHGLRAKDSSFSAAYELIADPDLPRVHVVPQDMGRVLLNLIGNAFYACAERSRSAVHEQAKLDIEGYQPKVTVRTRKLENAIEITVHDNGNGIPESIREKIFQPFFTTKPAGQGTGLGLSLAYDVVVKGHGGTLEVESREGVFTEFRIVLPVPDSHIFVPLSKTNP